MWWHNNEFTHAELLFDSLLDVSTVYTIRSCCDENVQRPFTTNVLIDFVLTNVSSRTVAITRCASCKRLCDNEEMF